MDEHKDINQSLLNAFGRVGASDYDDEPTGAFLRLQAASGAVFFMPVLFPVAKRADVSPEYIKWVSNLGEK